MEKNIDY